MDSLARPNGERTAFDTGLRPTRTRFSSRRPPSSKSRRQSEEYPLARQYAPALDKWLDGLVATFSNVIHPVDVKVAMRAGELMRSWRGGLPIHRFHDVLLVATAQVHGHFLLTKRETRSSAPGQGSNWRPPERGPLDSRRAASAEGGHPGADHTSSLTLKRRDGE